MPAIKAGIAGGIVLVVLQLISNFIPLIGCILSLVSMVVMLGVGVLALYFGPKYIKSLVDALMASGLAGVVAGLIDGIVILILAVAGGVLYTNSAIGTGASIMAGLISLVFVTVMTTVLAVLGGLIYAFLVLKVTK